MRSHDATPGPRSTLKGAVPNRTSVSRRVKVFWESAVPIGCTAGASTAPDLELNESAWVATQHKNKFGQDYPAAAYKR